jgi:hypothetical protein
LFGLELLHLQQRFSLGHHGFLLTIADRRARKADVADAFRKGTPHHPTSWLGNF